MNAYTIVFAVALVLLVASFIFEKPRLLWKAVFGGLFEKATEKPEVIGQFYNQKIDQLNEVYSNVNSSCQLAHGKLAKAKKQLEMAQRGRDGAQRKMAEAHKRGDIDGKQIFAREAMSAQKEIDVLKEAIPGLEEDVKMAETLRKRAINAIDEVESQKKIQITKAEIGKAKKEIYDSFDSKQVSNTIDKILADYSRFADSQEEMGIGAEKAWESSPEAQHIEAEERALNYSVESYIDEFFENQDKEV